MITDLIDDYVDGKDVIVTAPSGFGSTSFSIFITNYLCKNKLIYYFDFSGGIDRKFVQENYNLAFKDVLFIQTKIVNIADILQNLDPPDIIVLDPGDALLVNRSILPSLKRSNLNIKLLCTSQLRQNISTKRMYSTLEESYMELFDYSFWIRTVSETKDSFIDRRYLDIFDKKRRDNNSIGRHILKFSISGGVIA